MKKAVLGITCLGVVLLVLLGWESLSFRLNRFLASHADFSWTSSSTPADEEQLKPNPSFLRAIDQLTSFLEERNSTLEIVFLPLLPSIYQSADQETLRNQQGENSKATWYYVGRLLDRGITASYPLEAVARAARMISPAPLFLDEQHYLHTGLEIVANHLENNGNEQTMLLIGDCHAGIFVKQLQQTSLANVRSLGRNAAGTRMAVELPLLPESLLPRDERVVWLVMDTDLDKEFPSLSPEHTQASGDSGEFPTSGLQKRFVTIEALTPSPPETPTATVYTSGLIAHRFRSEKGEEFVGITQLFKNRYFIPGVNLWEKNQQLAVSLQAWREAVDENPSLASEQLLDDTQGWDLPRFYIRSWIATQSATDRN